MGGGSKFRGSAENRDQPCKYSEFNCWIKHDTGIGDKSFTCTVCVLCVIQVCDRYAYSGVAFSAAKGLDLDWCKSCDDGLIAPDCIIYLDMSVEDAAKRGSYGEERYEKEEFQRAVRSKFMELKSRDTVPWFVIDACQAKETIHESISAIADGVIERLHADSPLSQLWGGLRTAAADVGGAQQDESSA